jgi:hypothetical protein
MLSGKGGEKTDHFMSLHNGILKVIFKPFSHYGCTCKFCKKEVVENMNSELNYETPFMRKKS